MTCARTDAWTIETARACSCETCEQALADWRTEHWFEWEAARQQDEERFLTYRAPPHQRRQLKQMLLDRTGGKCALCGDPTSLDLPSRHPAYATIDHIRPRSRGGDDSLTNLQIACLSCNQKKGDKWEETG